MAAARLAINRSPLFLVRHIIIYKEFRREVLDVIERHGIAGPAAILALAVGGYREHQLLGEPLLILPEVELQLTLAY